jgi:hypothetical protein
MMFTLDIMNLGRPEIRDAHPVRVFEDLVIGTMPFSNRKRPICYHGSRYAEFLDLSERQRKAVFRGRKQVAGSSR